MKKQLLIIGITLVLIAVGLSGCTDNNPSSKSNADKIIGTWDARDTSIAESQPFVITFYTNNSLKYVYADQVPHWETYAITDTILTSRYIFYEKSTYTFTDNDNKLTIITDYGANLILTRK